jgi:dienelactone hydrolase
MLRLLPAVAALTLATTAHTQTSPFWGELDRGPYDVGFAARYEFDASRSFWPPDSTEVHDLGRPLRILIWYPAEPSADTTMTFAAYRQVRPTDERLDYYNRVLRGWEHTTAARQFSPESDSLLDVVSAVRTMARRDVPTAAGRFPLIVHSLGLGDYQLEQTILFEYLASHGYVVATVPQVGAAPWDRSSFDAASVETQAADVAFVLDLLRRAEYVDAARLAITGHSMGGLVGLVVAARDPRVRAVVGLDASFVTPDGNALLTSMQWPASQMLAAVLDIHRRRDDVDRTSLERLAHADRYEVTIGGTAPPEIATHYDFQNWPVYSTLVGIEDPRGVNARPATFGLRVLLASVRMTRRFLDATLGGRTPRMEEIVAQEATSLPLGSAHSPATSR